MLSILVYPINYPIAYPREEISNLVFLGRYGTNGKGYRGKILACGYTMVFFWVETKSINGKSPIKFLGLEMV
jgi:hypothetical protein